jgi:hypothetical protein
MIQKMDLKNLRRCDALGDGCWGAGPPVLRDNAAEFAGKCLSVISWLFGRGLFGRVRFLEVVDPQPRASDKKSVKPADG